MMTAYDLRWDEETLTGWDFYDAFQSINFLENGYRIAVPRSYTHGVYTTPTILIT